jgi:hypothetical protein
MPLFRHLNAHLSHGGDGEKCQTPVLWQKWLD